MKTRDILLLAGVGLLAWWYLKKKDKPLMKEDLSAGQGGSPKPTFVGDASPKPVPPIGIAKAPITVEDLSLKLKQTIPTSEYVMPVLEKPTLREPISIPATNLIPNIYDRGVNQPLAPNDQYYASFAGSCSEDLQTACKCATTKKEKYKLDIPKLP